MPIRTWYWPEPFPPPPTRSTCWSRSTRTLPPTLSSMSRRSPLWMVLCRCQRGDSPGSEALLQALRFRGRFGHQPDEGFHGREAEPGDDAQSHHRQGPLHRGQCEPLLLSHYRLRLEARLHLGNTQLQREGRDSKSCHQSMEQRICQLKQSSQASSH